MRYMMIVKGSKKSEAGVMPTEQQMAAMGKYNEELQKAGVLLDLSGLKPTSKAGEGPVLERQARPSSTARSPRPRS